MVFQIIDKIDETNNQTNRFRTFSWNFVIRFNDFSITAFSPTYGYEIKNLFSIMLDTFSHSSLYSISQSFMYSFQGLNSDLTYRLSVRDGMTSDRNRLITW